MTRKKSRLFPKHRPEDSTPMKNAVALLESMHVKFRRPSLNQLKIGWINYYPDQGTLHVDGEPRRRRERGKGALMKVLAELAEKNEYYVRKRQVEEQLAKIAALPDPDPSAPANAESLVHAPINATASADAKQGDQAPAPWA